MKDPKISVLMPVYKTNEAHLRQAIESILNQSYTDFEFLILDDCPENDRESIVKSYPDKRLKYFKNERNRGISFTRNKLMEMAKGEYLAVMDHDDISLPERFEKQVAFLDEHPEVGVVACWAEEFPKFKKLMWPVEDIQIKTNLMEICCLIHPATMMRKSVLVENHIEYEAEFSPAEDYRLWGRLIEYTNFHNIPEVLFKYRNHLNNTTHTQRDKMALATQAIHAFVQNKYPLLYSQYLKIRYVKRYIRLFQVIPFLMITEQNKEKIVYLFNKIPLFSVKEKSQLRLKNK